MKRRSFLIGSAGGLVVLALTACTPPKPTPTASATPKPRPTTPSGVPQPKRMARSNWGTDPFARGAYSYPTVDNTDEQRSLLRRSVGERVFFAGEATSSDAPGTVHGALGSGLRAALDIADAAERGERIAVIGAGIAGLTAARQLREAGFDVVIVEARDRIGGRIQSEKAGAWPIAVELGPLFVSGDSTVLAGQLSLAGVTTEPFTRTPEARTTHGDVVEQSDAGARALDSALTWSHEQGVDSSVAQALLDSGAAAALSPEPNSDGVAPADWLTHELATHFEPAVAASADLASSLQSPLWLANNAAMTDIVAGTEDGLVGLIDSLADGLDVLTGSPVTTIVWGDNGVSLRLAQGESLSAARVLVTIPLGVLQNEPALFEPELPGWKLEAITGIGMGTVDTVWLHFDDAFWATDATQLSVFNRASASADPLEATAASDSPVAYWTNLEPLTGNPILVGTIAAEHAAELAELSDDEFSARVLASLQPYADDAQTLAP